MSTELPEMDLTASSLDLAEERLRLEREALAVERERLAAARAHAEAEARLAVKAHHPVLLIVSVVLLSLLCFAGGVFTGFAVMEGRQQRQREKNLARALSQLDEFKKGMGGSSSNALPVKVGERIPESSHPNVSVMVIQ